MYRIIRGVYLRSMVEIQRNFGCYESNAVCIFKKRGYIYNGLISDLSSLGLKVLF
jgi:hypothetical protein